jgi:cell division protein FtsN
MKMITNKAVLSMFCAVLLATAGCSRQQSDWEKTRAANSSDAYEQFIKKYPNGEFTAQAQARVKELYEERDWQKARDADTQEAYQAFLKDYPEGKWTEEARIRVENFTLAQAPSNTTPAGAQPATPANAAPNPSAAATAPAPSAAAKSAKPAAKAASAPTAAPKAAPAKAAATSTPAGSYGIQLGAFKSSADAANRRWAHLDKEYPKLLNGLSPTVAPTTGASPTLYRLQVAGLTSKHAREICKVLKSKSQACVVIHPARHKG